MACWGVVSFPITVFCKQDSSTVPAATEKQSLPESNDGKLFKDETVYAIADANGKPAKIIVSDWLKKP